MTLTFIALLAFCILVWIALLAAREVKDAKRQRQARIAILAVALVFLGAWFLGVQGLPFPPRPW